MRNLPGAGIFFLLGALIAYVNYRLTKRAAERSGQSGSGQSGTLSVASVSVVRMLLSIGLLAAAYLLGPLTPWDRIWLLAGAVVGLTVPMFAFTALLVRQTNRERTASDRPDGQSEKGSDRNG